MTMFKKILIIFIIPVLLYGCGYSTLYSTKNNQNINIKVLDSSGDLEINNFLISNLKKYSGNEGRTFLVSINTNYSAYDNSKNLEGSISTADEEVEVTVAVDVGTGDGAALGNTDGVADGALEGTPLGTAEGPSLGTPLGESLGTNVGLSE